VLGAEERLRGFVPRGGHLYATAVGACALDLRLYRGPFDRLLKRFLR
jgi:hypothetical protein